VSKHYSELKKDLIEHGWLVISTGETLPNEHAHADAEGRFYVDDDGFGFVRRPKEFLEAENKRIATLEAHLRDVVENIVCDVCPFWLTKGRACGAWEGSTPVSKNTCRSALLSHFGLEDTP
jgi:hypothetical protein